MLFSTERLSLHEFTTADAEFILKLVNTPSWLEYIGDRGVKSIDDAEKYLLNGSIKSYSTTGFGFWKVSLKDSGVPVGMCGFVKRESLDDIDLGFAFLPQHEGKGYGYEAAKASLEYAKGKWNLNRVVAITVGNNQPSIKLLEKLGFRFERMVTLPKDDEELMLYAFEQ